MTPSRIFSTSISFAVTAAVCVTFAPPHARAEDAPAPAQAPAAPDAAAPASGAELAKKLSNPIASLISVPLQLNYDGEIGPLRQGGKFTLNFQPVIPIRLSNDWNLISRTIVPVVTQNSIFPGVGAQTGLSDSLQSLFLSPSRPGKLIWGVGPALLVPTGTDALLSTGKWSAGPTFVVLTQSKGFTAGLLANQLWSFAGNSNRPTYDKAYFQPFFSFTTKKATTYGLSSEGTYDWQSKGLSMPVIGTVSQILKIGHQIISVGAAVKYYAATVDNGPHGFGGHLVLTFLYPKR